MDWEALSAMSNIVLSFLTLGALSLTLYTVVISNVPKGKMYFKVIKLIFGKRAKITFVNKRNVPITVVLIGFYTIINGEREILISKSDKIKLNRSDVINFSSLKKDLNSKLLKKDFIIGESVNLFPFVQTSDNHIYKKKYKFTVLEKEYYEP